MNDNVKKYLIKSWKIFKKRKILTFSLIAGIFLTVVLIKIFSYEQALPKVQSNFIDDSIARISLATKLSNARGDFFGISGKKIFKIKLKKAEINSLFKLMTATQRDIAPDALEQGLLKQLINKKTNIFIEDNLLVIGFTGQIKFFTPFGRCINTVIKLKPTIIAGQDQIKVTEIRVGSFNIIGTSFINDAIAEELAKDEYQRFIELVKEISIKDDVMTVAVNREKLVKLISLGDALQILAK